MVVEDVRLEGVLAEGEEELLTPTGLAAGVDVENDGDEAPDALDGNRLSVKVQKRHGFMKKERIGTSRSSRGFGVDGGGVVIAVFVVGGGGRLALRGGVGGRGLLFLRGGGGFLLGH